MKRPRSWFHWLLMTCLLFVLGQYIALTWVIPQHIKAAIERATGGTITASDVRLFFPLTVRLSDVRLIGQDGNVVMMIRRVIMKPLWISVPRKTMWVDTLEIDQPLLQLRRTPAGIWMWPMVSSSLTTNPRLNWETFLASWQIHVGTLEMVDGTIQVLDEKPAHAFHALIDHVSMSLASVTLPFEVLHLNGAASGEVVGDKGHAAPFYCSGWLDLVTKDLQTSCQLKPLALAAFEPYYHGPPEVRVYNTTLSSTSQWFARNNQLQSRIQLELGHLEEGDISVHGRNIIDVKKLTRGQTSQLKGELNFVGPLGHPSQWHGMFLAGDESIQHLVDRLLERGVKSVRITPWGTELRISMLPASKETMSDIEVASKEVQEALDILVSPTPEETQAATGSVTPESPSVEPAPATNPSPAPLPGGAPTASPPAPDGTSSTPPTSSDQPVSVTPTTSPSGSDATPAAPASVR